MHCNKKVTKEQLNKIIHALDKNATGKDLYELGLPTWEEECMAKMREIIREILEEEVAA